MLRAADGVSGAAGVNLGDTWSPHHDPHHAQRPNHRYHRMEGLADRVGVFAATAAIVALIAFLMLGIAITVTAVLFIVVPVAIGVALIASLFRPRT